MNEGVSASIAFELMTESTYTTLKRRYTCKMSGGKEKIGDVPSFVLIGGKVELLLNIANEYNDHN